MMDLMLEPYAARFRFNMPAELPGLQWEKMLADFMTQIAIGCMGEDRCVIGHIKGFADFGDNTFLKIGLVSATQSPDMDGNVPDVADTATVTLNVLVFGVSKKRIEEIVTTIVDFPDSAWKGYIKQLSGEIC